MCLFKISDFLQVSWIIFQRLVTSPGGGFKMVEFGVRCPQIAETSRLQSKAKINVIEGDCQVFFVKTTD